MSKQDQREVNTTTKRGRKPSGPPKVYGKRPSELHRKVLRQPSYLTKQAKQNSRTPQLANEEREAIMAKRAVELYGIEGRPMSQVAEILEQEYSMESRPQLSTICRLLKKGKIAFWDDVKTMQKMIRMEQFNEVELLKQDWKNRMVQYRMNVRRTVMQDGEPVEIIDENAFKEQAKAAEVYLRCCSRQAALIGLDLSEETKAAGADLQSFFMQINNQVHYGTPSPKLSGATLESPAVIERIGKLELRAGGEVDEI